METIIFFLDDRKDFSDEIFKQVLKMGADVTLPFGEVNTEIFSDGEVSVDFKTSVRGKRVYIISSPDNSDKLIQLNMAIDGAKRAAAKEIIPIIPYFPYARQDKKDQIRGSIGAKVVAEMIENRGATSIVTFDLHADQIQGFFNIPVIHMEGKYLFAEKIKELYDTTSGNLVLCSPDAGGTKRVKGVRDRMREKYNIDIPMVMIDKTRSKANEIDEMVLIGDVRGRDILIVDDMADTCGTLIKASKNLLEKGGKSVRSIVTHGVLSGPAIERLYKAIEDGVLMEFICSDTISIQEWVTVIPKRIKTNTFITTISSSNQIIKAIQAINLNTSVENLKKS
jgi:ribose-phosphate pyrophosphokinase